MTVYVHRPDTPKEVPPPTLGMNVGHLHAASGGQLGCLIALLWLFGLFLLAMYRSSARDYSDDSTGAAFVILGVVTLVVLVARHVDRHKIQTTGPVLLPVTAADVDDEHTIEQMAADVSRFETMVQRAGLTAASGREIRHVAWVLWYAGVRVNRIGEITRAIRDAGSRASGPAKAAWVNERGAEAAALRAPVLAAAQQLADLADLAEDVVYAAALARENGLVPGEMYGTLGLDLPQPFDTTTADAIEEVTDRLRAWHSAWVELDERLRAATEELNRRRDQ